MYWLKIGAINNLEKGFNLTKSFQMILSIMHLKIKFIVFKFILFLFSYQNKYINKCALLHSYQSGIYLFYLYYSTVSIAVNSIAFSKSNAGLAVFFRLKKCIIFQSSNVPNILLHNIFP